MFRRLIAGTRTTVSTTVATALIASLLAVTAGSVASAEARSTSRPQVGTNFHVMWSDYTNDERLEAIRRLADAGVEWVRVDMGWVTYEEAGKGVYSQWAWDRADFVVDNLRANGIKVLGMLWATPGWANGGQKREVPPSDPADYGDIAFKAAQHFKGRVDAWEVWNEPNLDYFFKGTAADYVRLLKAAYPRFKAGDPNAQVVLGGVSYNDTKYLRRLYELGAQGHFDVMATHPYLGVADAPPETPDDGTIWTMVHVKAVHDLMTEFGDGAKKIWFTEFGWSTHENWSGISNWERGVTKQKQADYLIRSIELMASKFPYVTNMFWYNERNEQHGHPQIDNYGLMYRDLSPKPAYTALQEYLTAGGSVPDEPVDDPDEGTSDPIADAPADGSGEESGEEQPALPPADPADGVDNLLSNGGFEEGLDPWKSPKGKARLAARSYTGDRSVRVRSAGAVRTLVSERVKLPQVSTLEASGYVRVPQRGKRIRLVVVEKREGRTVSRWGVRLRVMSDRWVQLPTVRYGTAGDTSVRVKLKMRSKRGRYFWADDLHLRTTSGH